MSVVAGAAGPPAAWWRVQAARRNRLYSCFAFGSTAGAERVAELASGAVCASSSWRAEGGLKSGGPAGVRTWRHSGTGAVLSLVVAGLHPLVVVAAAVELGPGLRGISDSGRSAASPLAAWHVRRALRRFAAAARDAGGREVLVSRLPELMRMAGERLSWRAEAEYGLGELARQERFRSCPRCAEQPEAGMRWCPACEYEFTAADDHAHDLQNARRRQQADRLRHGLAQILIDEFPPVSAAPRFPVPPAGPWAARS